jgi:transcriptional regulator with XRE-family HTH domain
MKKIIGERFKDFRKKIGKTQKELAQEAEMSQANIAKIENGEIFPNLEILISLYSKYNLNIHWIISGKGDSMLRGQKDYGEYNDDMEELLFYLNNSPRVRYAILKYFLIYKYKNRDSMPKFLGSLEQFNTFEVLDELSDELSKKNQGDA